MRVLVDTDIVLDLILDRELFAADAELSVYTPSVFLKLLSVEQADD